MCCGMGLMLPAALSPACCPQPCLLWQSSQPLGRGAASLTQLPALPGVGAPLACSDLPSEDQDGDQDVSAAR